MTLLKSLQESLFLVTAHLLVNDALQINQSASAACLHLIPKSFCFLSTVAVSVRVLMAITQILEIIAKLVSLPVNSA